MFTVQMDEDYYRLCGPDGEEGQLVPYGETAILKIDEALYYCHVEDGDEDAPVVYEVLTVKRLDSDTEDVEFPKEILAAQAALDTALERQAAIVDATVEDMTEGTD